CASSTSRTPGAATWRTSCPSWPSTCRCGWTARWRSRAGSSWTRRRSGGCATAAGRTLSSGCFCSPTSTRATLPGPSSERGGGGADDIGRMRLAGEADRGAVEELVHDAYTPWIEIIGAIPLPLEADYAALIAAGRVHVTDGLEGLIVLVPEDGVLLVENVAVRPELHGQGIGRGQLAYAADEA